MVYCVAITSGNKVNRKIVIDHKDLTINRRFVFKAVEEIKLQKRELMTTSCERMRKKHQNLKNSYRIKRTLDIFPCYISIT